MTWYRQACDSSNLEICGENKPGVTSVRIHLYGLGEWSVSRTKQIPKAQGVRPLWVDSARLALPWKSVGVCWKQPLHQLCPQRSVTHRFQIHWTKRTLFTRINLQTQQRWVVNTHGLNNGSEHSLTATNNRKYYIKIMLKCKNIRFSIFIKK